MTLTDFHGTFSDTTGLFFLLVGLWGVWRGIKGLGIDGSYLGAMAIGEGLYIIQAIVGTILWMGGSMPGRGVHFLYGVFALLFLPFVYFVLLKGDDSNRGQWAISFALLFLAGIAARAIQTAL